MISSKGAVLMLGVGLCFQSARNLNDTLRQFDTDPSASTRRYLMSNVWNHTAMSGIGGCVALLACLSYGRQFKRPSLQTPLVKDESLPKSKPATAAAIDLRKLRERRIAEHAKSEEASEDPTDKNPYDGRDWEDSKGPNNDSGEWHLG